MKNKTLNVTFLSIFIVIFALLIVTIVLAAILPSESGAMDSSCIPWYGWVMLSLTGVLSILSVVLMILKRRQNDREERRRKEKLSE